MADRAEIEHRPVPFDEAVAARKLGVSKATLTRERLAGRVHPIRMGARIIRYTDEILDEYLSRCRNAPDKSETTGSPSERGQTAGIERGTTKLLDRQDAHRLAQATFRRPS